MDQKAAVYAHHGVLLGNEKDKLVSSAAAWMADPPPPPLLTLPSRNPGRLTRSRTHPGPLLLVQHDELKTLHLYFPNLVIHSV